jgi:hypothetical protein
MFKLKKSFKVLLFVLLAASLISCASTNGSKKSNQLTGTYEGVCSKQISKGKLISTHEVTATFKETRDLILDKQFIVDMETFPTENNEGGSCGSYSFKGSYQNSFTSPYNTITHLTPTKVNYHNQIIAGEKFDTAPNIIAEKKQGRAISGKNQLFFKWDVKSRPHLDGCYLTNLKKVSSDIVQNSQQSRKAECENRPIPRCKIFDFDKETFDTNLASCNLRLAREDPYAMGSIKKRTLWLKYCQATRICSSVLGNKECLDRGAKLKKLNKSGAVINDENQWIFMASKNFLQCDPIGIDL